MTPTRLLVRMRGIGGPSSPVETMCYGVRRVVVDDERLTDRIQAFAWIPLEYRQGLEKRKALQLGEYAWCTCIVAENARAVTPFVESGEFALFNPDVAAAARAARGQAVARKVEAVTAIADPVSELVKEWPQLADDGALFSAHAVRSMVLKAVSLALTTAAQARSV